MTVSGAAVHGFNGLDERAQRSLDGPAVRSVRATDKPALADLFQRLSPESRRHRFLGPKKTLSPRELERLTAIDHVEREALAAIRPDGQFIAVARYGPAPGAANAADVALTVADQWQRRGIGTAMAHLLIAQARRHRIARLRAMTLADNHAARNLMRSLGFTICGIDGEVISLELHLRS